eukprot:3853215-Prymnesium_polylepis.1
MSRHLSRDISWIPKCLGIYRDLSSIWLRQKTRLQAFIKNIIATNSARARRAATRGATQQIMRMPQRTDRFAVTRRRVINARRKRRPRPLWRTCPQNSCWQLGSLVQPYGSYD